MKYLNFIFSAIFLVFLISSVSALTVYAGFDDETQFKTLEYGSSINFQVDFFSMNPPMNLIVELRDSSDKLIYTFLNTQISSYEYNKEYNLNSSVYKSLGSYSIIAKGIDKINSQQYDELRVNVVDTTKPVITLLGNSIVNLTLGETYTDAGASALDNLDGDITSKIIITGSVNTNVLGTYILHYNVKDAAGNSANEKTRTVNVLPPIPVPPIDTLIPSIEIVGPINNTVYKEEVKFLNFIARDENLDKCQYSLDNGSTKNNVSCVSGVLNTVSITSKEGRNDLTIYAIDKTGNTAIVSIVFYVDSSIVDIIPPTMTIFIPEDNKKYTSKSITFKVATDENASVYFSLDNGNKIKMNNPYDHIFTYTLELADKSHKITFYATDNFGNTANKTIEFVVDYQTVNKKDRTTGTVSLNQPFLTQQESNTTSVDASAYNIGENTIVLVPEKTIKKNFFTTLFESIINFFKKLFNIK